MPATAKLKARRIARLRGGHQEGLEDLCLIVRKLQ